MKKLLILALITASLSSCIQEKPAQTASFDNATEEKAVAALLDTLNVRAGKAQFEPYFSLYAEDAIFAGTDANERWDKAAFKVWAKPYFDAGKAWRFTAIQRNIYFDESGKIGWFDELLNTQMKICRGSGVVVKEGDSWKIKQYILSMTVPNDNIDAVMKAKAPIEDALIEKLKTRQ